MRPVIGSSTKCCAQTASSFNTPYSEIDHRLLSDMVVAGAIAGALIGRATCDAHAVILFERRQGI